MRSCNSLYPTLFFMDFGIYVLVPTWFGLLCYRKSVVQEKEIEKTEIKAAGERELNLRFLSTIEKNLEGRE